jgi:hypothetical protein
MVFTNWLREAGRVYDDRPSERRCQARAKNKVSKESERGSDEFERVR